MYGLQHISQLQHGYVHPHDVHKLFEYRNMTDATLSDSKYSYLYTLYNYAYDNLQPAGLFESDITAYTTFNDIYELPLFILYFTTTLHTVGGDINGYQYVMSLKTYFKLDERSRYYMCVMGDYSTYKNQEQLSTRTYYDDHTLPIHASTHAYRVKPYSICNLLYKYFYRSDKLVTYCARYRLLFGYLSSTYDMSQLYYSLSVYTHSYSHFKEYKRLCNPSHGYTLSREGEFTRNTIIAIKEYFDSLNMSMI